MMNPLIEIFFRGGEKNDRSRSTERGCPFKANLSFRARSPLRDRLLNEAISRPIGWVTRYQASSRGFFPLAAVTIFAEHLNGILHRLSLSLSRCSRRQPIPRAYDRKVCAIITVVIARAYTRHLTPRREDRGWRIPNIIDGQIVEEIGALMHYSRDIDIYPSSCL